MVQLLVFLRAGINNSRIYLVHFWGHLKRAFCLVSEQSAIQILDKIKSVFRKKKKVRISYVSGFRVSGFQKTTVYGVFGHLPSAFTTILPLQCLSIALERRLSVCGALGMALQM